MSVQISNLSWPRPNYLFIFQQIPSFSRISCLDGTLSFSIAHVRTPRSGLTSGQPCPMSQLPPPPPIMPLSLEARTVSWLLSCLLASVLTRIPGIYPLHGQQNNPLHLSVISPWHSRCIQASLKSGPPASSFLLLALQPKCCACEFCSQEALICLPLLPPQKCERVWLIFSEGQCPSQPCKLFCPL